MAASKDFASSTLKSSEETFDSCCSPCYQAGTMKETRNFCVDCESYFCGDCLFDHNKFTALRSHRVMDKSENERSQKEGTGSCLPTERCAVHHGQVINMYCGNHDEVCCVACTAIKHRACVNVDYLTNIAKGIHDSAELKETLVSLNDVLVNIKEEREKRVDNLATLDQERDHHLKEVEEFERELIHKIKELAEGSKHQISAKHEEYRKSIQADVDKLDIVISTMGSSVQRLSGKNDAQLFVHVKNGQKSVKDCKNMLREMSEENEKKQLKFTPNAELRNMLSALESIAFCVEDIKEYKATLYGLFNVTPNHCEVTGACVMEDGTFLVSDHTNKKLKRLNRDFTVKDQLHIDGSPYSLQIVGPAEVVVFCSRGNIHFVSVGDIMQITATFNTCNCSSGGLYNISNNEIFLLKAEHMCIYKKNGDIVRTYENKDITQNPCPKQTALSDDNNIIFFANDENGLLALTREGKTLWSFKDPELSYAWGVCVLPGDIILVSGFGSNNILQVDKDGRKIGTLIAPTENIIRPCALAYDRKSSRLLVGYYSDKILVRIYRLHSISD